MTETPIVSISFFRMNTRSSRAWAMGMMGVGDIIVWDYLTTAGAWFIKTDVPNGLMLFNRRALALTQDNDFDTENAKMKATERYVFGWAEPRGIWGSPGA